MLLKRRTWFQLICGVAVAGERYWPDRSFSKVFRNNLLYRFADLLLLLKINFSLYVNSNSTQYDVSFTHSDQTHSVVCLFEWQTFPWHEWYDLLLGENEKPSEKLNVKNESTDGTSPLSRSLLVLCSQFAF